MTHDEIYIKVQRNRFSLENNSEIFGKNDLDSSI